MENLPLETYKLMYLESEFRRSKSEVREKN